MWRWCSRSTTRGGHGATSSTRTPGNAGAARLAVRGSNPARIIGSRFGSPATDSASSPTVDCLWPKWARCGCAGRGSCPAEPSSVTIIREPDGHYYASFVVDVAATPLPATDREAGRGCGDHPAGDDRGHRWATHGRGQPKASGTQAAQTRRLEREKSRRQKGSTNRDKTRRKVAIAHNEVARARRDYHHKQALALVRENQVIHVEDLNIVGMVANRRLARAISDAGWGQFVRIIAEKADRYGRTVAFGVAVAGVEQDLLAVRASPRRAAVAGPVLDVPGVPGRPRPRPQRRQGHSRRRAGGETKRLWSRPVEP